MQEKKELNVRVGANIQAARENHGYTQEQLSEILNITPNHLSAIERGVTGATLEKIVQLCHLFGMSADSLLFGGAQPDDFAKDMAAQLSGIKMDYRPQVQKILTTLLEIFAMRNAENE